MKSKSQNSLAIVTPVLNDWVSLGRLADAFASMSLDIPCVDLVVVDDGSAVELPLHIVVRLRKVGDVHVLRLARTVGHQRAIAFGLRYITDTFEADRVLVMDADGEDPPEALPFLLEKADSNPDSIIVACRGRRVERTAFRVGYRFYRAAFRALVGLRLNFGNFVLLPSAAARRIATEESVWLSFAATVARSQIPKSEVLVNRAPRFDGESRMNQYGLVTHGLGAMAVFADRIFIRVVAVSVSLLAISFATLVAVLYARLWTSAAIPGWATTAAGLSLLFAGQVLATSLLTMFVMLQQRLNMLPIIARFADSDILTVRKL